MKTPICPTCSCSLVRLGVGKDAAVAYCYNGEDYLFCCRGCVDIFITDPEKYLAEIKGLAVCPTCLGEKPLERTIRMEHDAVVLHFCRCPHCLKEFTKNPEYYINRIEDSTILKPAGSGRRADEMERKIIVYSATGWASCHAAKEFLSHHKIPFTDRNVVEDPKAMDELVEKIGRRATPVIIVDEEIIVGFDRGRLERILGLWGAVMGVVLCPGCGEEVSLDGLKVGDQYDCPNCANLTLRVKEKNGSYFLEEVPKVSCPTCDRLIEVPEGFGPGDTLACCGEEFTLTYEFGAYALQRIRRNIQK